MTRRTRGQPSALLVILLAAPFLASADSTVANVATPSIRHSLDASGSDAQFVVGGYIVAYAVLLITGARLGQTHGYKRLFLLGVSLFGVTSLGGGLAPDIALLIVMRVLSGRVRGADAHSGADQLQFSGERRTRAIGQYAVALSIGALAGQILGGLLLSADISGASWRPIFLVNVPICLAVLAWGSRVLPADDHRERSRVDMAGAATLSVAVLCIVAPPDRRS